MIIIMIVMIKMMTIQEAEVDNEKLVETLVHRASNHVTSEGSIRLSKSAWLAGQFLGEICDYEPGTKLLQYVSLCNLRHIYSRASSAAAMASNFDQ